MNDRCVLDASALLALLNEEPGSQYVAEAIEQGAVMGAVNFSEVAAKLNETGMPDVVVHEILNDLGMEIVHFDRQLAYMTGILRLQTRKAGLSFGDRACLATAQRLESPCMTADKIWGSLDLPIQIKCIR